MSTKKIIFQQLNLELLVIEKQYVILINLLIKEHFEHLITLFTGSLLLSRLTLEVLNVPLMREKASD